MLLESLKGAQNVWIQNHEILCSIWGTQFNHNIEKSSRNNFKNIADSWPKLPQTDTRPNSLLVSVSVSESLLARLTQRESDLDIKLLTGLSTGILNKNWIVSVTLFLTSTAMLRTLSWFWAQQLSVPLRQLSVDSCQSHDILSGSSLDSWITKVQTIHLAAVMVVSYAADRSVSIVILTVDDSLDSCQIIWQLTARLSRLSSHSWH